jgi:cell division ATPase FtsA
MGASLTEVSVFFSGTLNFLDVIPRGANDIKAGLKEDGAFNDIISRIKAGAEDFVKKGGSIKSVILTGGLAFSEGVAEEVEEKLGYRVKMGMVRNLQGNISSADSLRGVTAIGLARYASIQYQPKPFQPKGLIQDISNKVTEIFNNYF